MEHPSGFGRVYEWWFTVPGFDTDTLSVLGILGLHDKRGTGQVWPAQGTIAKMCGRSRAWVNKQIARLVEMGLISKTGRIRADGGWSSCVYRINYERPAQQASDANKPVTPVTGAVSEDDTKEKNPNKHTPISVSDWKPDPDLVASMEDQTSPITVERFIARYRQRVRNKGYYYADLDLGLKTWWEEDRVKLQNSVKAEPVRRAARSTHTLLPAADLSERLSSDLAVFRKTGALAPDTGRERLVDVAIHEAACGDAATYENWLRRLSLESCDREQIVLAAPNAFVASKVQVAYGDAILGTLARLGLSCRRIRIEHRTMLSDSRLHGDGEDSEHREERESRCSPKSLPG